MAGPDYIVEIDGVKTSTPHVTDAGENKFQGRPWLSIYWRCCLTYNRIYRNADHTAYEGRCPRCCRPVQVRVGRDGTNGRLFQAQ